jgi:hypothetical protein
MAVDKGNIFIKIYRSAMESGLIRELGDKNLRTLIVLGMFMDEKGICFPSQELLGQYLGVRREKANARIQSLLEFRFQEKPVLTLIEKRGRQNVYRIEPTAQIAIFGREIEVPDTVDMLQNRNTLRKGNTLEEDMLRKCNNDMLPKRNTLMLRKGNTNKKQYNDNHNNNNHMKEQYNNGPSAHTVDNKDNNTVEDNKRDINNGNICKDNITVNPSSTVESFKSDIKEEQETPGLGPDLAEFPMNNSRDVCKYFAAKYQDKYGVPYMINWSRDGGMVKNKLWGIYTPEQLRAIIDVSIEEYFTRWYSKNYPSPTIGQLCSWLANKAMIVVQEREQKRADLERRMETAKSSGATLEDMERWLGKYKDQEETKEESPEEESPKKQDNAWWENERLKKWLGTDEDEEQEQKEKSPEEEPPEEEPKWDTEEFERQKQFESWLNKPVPHYIRIR